MSTPLGQVMAGCTVLVTADRRKHELASALERRGARVRHAPALTMIPHADDEQLLAATSDLLRRPPDAVIVTTGIGFRSWFEAADAHGLADQLTSVLARARLIARGPKARGAIQAVGLTADWVAESETSAEIADLLLREGVAGQRIAVQQHGGGADGLDVVLDEAGADVVNLTVYRWGPPADPEALADSLSAAANGEIDAVVFTSAPGAEAWLNAVEEQVAAPILARFADGSMVAAAVGPVTAGPLERRGIHPLIPERGRLGALIRTLVAHYEHAETLALSTIAGPLQIRSRVAVLDGHLLPLSPSGLEVLRLLAARRGEVVTRDDVLAVLPGDAATGHAAEVAVARLREAMGRRDVVKTVVKRGYRLELT